MEVPVGMKEVFSSPDETDEENTCYQLLKGIYGLCQSARKFWKKFVNEMIKIDVGFKISEADPCLLYRENKLGICMIIIYVDDMMVIGNEESIIDVQERMNKVFSIKTETNLTDCLGCEFHMNKDKTKGLLGQPSIIRSLEKEFGEEAMKHRLGLTPGTPRFMAMRVAHEKDKLPAKEHATYRSGVGTLLYLTKHSRPDLWNTVRELSKRMDRPAPIHPKEMYRIIRYVLETKRYGLKFYLKRCSWIIQAFSDSDFARDKETRRSVYGYFILRYFCGIPIVWKSKGMRSVVLSTTEAEYIALSEVVK